MGCGKFVNEADNTHLYEEAAPLLHPYEANERAKFIEDVNGDDPEIIFDVIDGKDVGTLFVAKK